MWDEVAKSYGYDGKKFTEDEPQSSGLGKYHLLSLSYLLLYSSLFTSKMEAVDLQEVEIEEVQDAV